MGPIGSPETSVANYQPMLRNILEERRPQVHRGKRMKLCSLRGFVTEIKVQCILTAAKTSNILFLFKFCVLRLNIEDR